MRIFETDETQAYYKDLQDFADENGITLKEAVMLDIGRTLRALTDRVDYLGDAVDDATGRYQ